MSLLAELEKLERAKQMEDSPSLQNADQLIEDGLHFFEREMLETIEDVLRYTSERKTRRMRFGDENLDAVFDDVEPHIYFFGGRPHQGKSALLLHTAWNIAKHNENAYVIYHSIDDPVHLLLPRCVAMESGIPIKAASKPYLFEDQPRLLEKREMGFEALKRTISRFKMYPAAKAEAVEDIEAIAQSHLDYFEQEGLDKNLVLVIDNFHDLSTRTASGEEKQERLQFIGRYLFDIADRLKVPILCSSELKKINSNRRPILDDLRETIKLQYLAGAIIMIHNDVVVKGEQLADISWDQNGRKRQVIEMHVVKNKVSGTKGVWFWEFEDEKNVLRASTPKAREAYLHKIS